MSEQQEAVRAAMASSIERQRVAVQDSMQESLHQQRRAVRSQVQRTAPGQETEDEDAFYTIPWPKSAMAAEPLAFAGCDPLPRAAIDSLVAVNARREGLQPGLLRAVMRRESGFRPCAVSRAGAQGLMQLMPATADLLRVTDPFDPEQNVAAGARFLRRLLNRYSGDVALALGAYNAGPGRVDEAGGIPDIRETRDYVGSILKSVVLD